MSHTCHARGCRRIVPPKLLMCLYHWRMLPKAIQRRVWSEYRPGQEIDKQPSPAYLTVMEEAIDFVAKAEAIHE